MITSGIKFGRSHDFYLLGNMVSSNISKNLPAQTVGRAVQLLKIIASSQAKSLRLVDISAMAGLEKSTAHRLLQRLEGERLITRAHNRGYQLGPLLYELGLAALPESNLKVIAQPALQELAQKTGDMVFLVIRSGFESVCLSRIAGHYPIQTMTRTEGDRHPLGMGAGGLSILAAMNDDDIDTTIEIIQPRLGAYQLTAAKLREAITNTRARNGVAIDKGTAAHDVCGIGYPIYKNRKIPVAAVFIATIQHRMMPDRQHKVIEKLLACTHRIESALKMHTSK